MRVLLLLALILAGCARDPTRWEMHYVTVLTIGTPTDEIAEAIEASVAEGWEPVFSNPARITRDGVEYDIYFKRRVR